MARAGRLTCRCRMTRKPREDWLDDRLTGLAGWASSAARVLWSTVQPDDVRGGCARILPGLLAVHERLTVGALEATDVYMMAVAADGGWLYAADWREDFPDRPKVTYTGEDVRVALGRTPLVVLNRVRRGQAVPDAMASGLAYVLGFMGTEAHEIGRAVTLARVLA